eukprot:984128_1
MKGTSLIATVMCCIIVFGEPYCKKAQVPFTSYTNVSDRVHFFLNCVYNYWKADNSYKAVPGFREMWGDIGYNYNDSTITVIDDERILGFRQWRAKVISSHNLMSFTMPENIAIYNWSAYEVFFSYSTNVTFNFPVLSGTQTATKSYLRSVYFEDDSGIVKYVWTNSTTTNFGQSLVYFKRMMRSSQYIYNALGYLNDVDEDGNPIMIIFICLFCALTIFVAVSVYVFLKCVFGIKLQK